MKRLAVGLILGCAFLVLPLGPVRADSILPAWASGIDVSVGPAMSPTATTAAMLEMNSASTVVNPDGSITFMNGMMTMPEMWEWSWMSLTIDPDPIVSMVGGFVNVSGVSQDFILSVLTPISPQVLPTSLIGGSTNLTYGDANGDGLGGLTNSMGSAGFSGMIDGSSVLDLLTSFSLSPGFPGDTTQSASQAIGLGGSSGSPLAGPAALSTIGITHRFNLSSFDQATYNSTFHVNPIPEPGTAILLGMGLMGLAARRRR